MKEHGTQTGTLRKVMHYLKRYWLLMALSILFCRADRGHDPVHPDPGGTGR